MTTAFSLPKIIEMEIAALVRAGYYSSKSDVAKDAFRNLLDTKKNLKLASAIELYRNAEVSLTRAAEIAEMDIESFKAQLQDRGIKIIIVAGSDIDEAAAEILKER